MKRAYASFYLDGREDRLLRNDVDLEVLADKVIAGAPLRETIHKAVTDDARARLETEKARKKWLTGHQDELEDGLVGDEAYAHYCDGRRDELEHRLEVEVLEEIAAMVDDGADEEDEAGDEAGKDDDDDDDDEGEDEDDKESED